MLYNVQYSFKQTKDRLGGGGGGFKVASGLIFTLTVFDILSRTEFQQ